MPKPPTNVELEERLISALVFSSETAAVCMAALGPSDFSLSLHSRMFETARDVIERNGELDMVSLRAACAGRSDQIQFCDEMLHSGYAYLSGQALDSAVALIKNLAVLRKLINACSKVLEWAHAPAAVASPETIIDLAGTEIGAALASREDAVRADTIENLMEPIVRDAMDIERGNKRAPRFIPAPLKKLDGLLDGFKAGQSVVIAGRPGSGKTVLGLQCAEAAMDFGEKVIIYSFEMSKEELAERVLAGRSNVDSKVINRRGFNVDQFRRMSASMHELIGKQMLVVDSARWTIEKIARHARRENMRSKLGMIVIDYLQLVKTERQSGSREQDVAEISRECKLLAKELACPVILLAQMNRGVESREGRVPQLSDLRESGAIEQDADVVLFISSSDETNDSVIYLKKQRGGPLGQVEVKFKKAYCRFEDAPVAA